MDKLPTLDAHASLEERGSLGAPLHPTMDFANGNNAWLWPWLLALAGVLATVLLAA